MQRRHVEAGGPGARQRVGRDERAGIVLAAVDAVGVGGERVDAGGPVKAEGEAGEELGVASAAAVARTVTVVSPPESSTAGARDRLAVTARREGDAGERPADLARLALDARRRGSAA